MKGAACSPGAFAPRRTGCAAQREAATDSGAAAQAMRTGSVRQLNEGLQAHQGAFIRAGTYLLMEKLRQAVCRRLLKRVWLLHREADPDKAHQLPLGARCPPVCYGA
jgi:hypothetical protein